MGEKESKGKLSLVSSCGWRLEKPGGRGPGKNYVCVARGSLDSALCLILGPCFWALAWAPMGGPSLEGPGTQSCAP